MSQHPPRIIIVGRPNVGKSTLFNRLYGRKRALVHDLPGVTRDRLEESAEWWFHGKPMEVQLVDTGGLGGERFTAEIEQQVKMALDQADVVLFLFDAQSGLIPADREILTRLKQAGVEKKARVFGVVNKVDAEIHESLAADFYSAGLEEIHTISAEHGRGIDDLKLAIYENLVKRGWSTREQGLTVELEPEAELDVEPEYEPETPRIAVVGRPNVGKSTLVNALLREERMITSPIAGTTVDAVDSQVMMGGKPYIFIDTAGIRRKNKTEQGVEVLSVVQAKKALERCHVAILLLDGEGGITDQDEKIGGLIEEAGCGVILAMNKWDTQRSNPKFTPAVAAELVRKKMAYLRYAPIVFMSAKQGRGFENLGDLVDEILAQRRVKVSTHEFTEWVRKESEIHNPMNAKFYLSHQSGRNPPTFVCHVNDPEKVHFSLRRHLVNALRERWGYMGSPVRMVFVEGKSTRKALSPAARLRKRGYQKSHVHRRG